MSDSRATPQPLSETLMELVAINRLRVHPVWEADILAQKRLVILRRHFHVTGFFVHRDAQEVEQSGGTVSARAEQIVKSLNMIFEELQECQERETPRLIWDRLRENDEHAHALSSINSRLTALLDNYNRVLIEEKGSLSKRRRETTLAWAETFVTAENEDLRFLRGLQNQTSDMIIMLTEGQIPEKLEVEQLKPLVVSQQKPLHGGKFVFVTKTPVAKGGFGAVHKGSREGVNVAAKRLVPFTREAHRLLPRLAREFLSMRALSHPNILPLISLSVGLGPKDSSFLVFLWASQGNARSFVKGKTFIRRLRVISETLNGLAYLHNHDVVHGDLKAANILIGDNSTVLLGDFSLSTSVSLTLPNSYSVHGYVDMTGCVVLPDQYWDSFGEETPAYITNHQTDLDDMDEGDSNAFGGSDDLTVLARGTRGWLAPEVLGAIPSASMQHMPTSDVYALGRTIYEASRMSAVPSIYATSLHALLYSS
ncbi:hypothetical protein FRB93_009316 [Tulasnella sp. JGI-2019a]|nr:hypothetical protein FRB93_009316 [Tulasnella sp. JGI-2019a]